MLEAHSPGNVGSLGQRLGKKISGYFSKGTGSKYGTPSSPAPAPTPVPLGATGVRARASSSGAAYGYTSASRARLASISAASVQRGGIAASLARRRASLAAMDASVAGVRPGTSFGAYTGRSSFAGTTADLSFAQRILLANENAVTNIADFWVASAMNVDNDEVFESDAEEDPADAPAQPTTSTATGAAGSSLSVPGDAAGRRGSISTVRGGLSRSAAPALGADDLATRRASVLPAIFQNAGLRTPPALLETPAQPFALLSETSLGQTDATSLPTIPESQPTSNVHSREATGDPVLDEKAPSLWSELPLAIIFQYALIALHTTTHDQVFLSYLVSPYEAGGLNLNPGHFAQLSAFPTPLVWRNEETDYLQSRIDVPGTDCLPVLLVSQHWVCFCICSKNNFTDFEPDLRADASRTWPCSGSVLHSSFHHTSLSPSTVCLRAPTMTAT
jgi:hypothetical protein